jgi:hypothetical protein
MIRAKLVEVLFEQGHDVRLDPLGRAFTRQHLASIISVTTLVIVEISSSVAGSVDTLSSAMSDIVPLASPAGGDAACSFTPASAPRAATPVMLAVRSSRSVAMTEPAPARLQPIAGIEAQREGPARAALAYLPCESRTQQRLWLCKLPERLKTRVARNLLAAQQELSPLREATSAVDAAHPGPENIP